LDKGKWVGIAGGLGLFLILLFCFIYINSDFDNQLINEVHSGVASDELNIKIQKESEKEENKALKHLKFHINDVNYWSKTKTSSKDDFENCINNYNMQIQAIEECEKVRRKYVNHEITEEYFLNEISFYKGRLETF
jgi:hypothetical protein